MRTVYPTGTTIYNPDACASGYTIYWQSNVVYLIDMNGTSINEWHIETDSNPASVDRARLLENGDVLVQRGGMMSTDGLLQQYSWDHTLVWEWIPENIIPHHNLLGPHHDVFRKPDGGTLAICRERVPDSYLANLRDPGWRNQVIYGDAIVEVDSLGKVVWLWHSHEHLDLNHRRLLASEQWPPGKYNSTVCDWTHVNTVQAIPENRHFDSGDDRFRPGNVLISPRQLDTVYIIDHDTHNVLWEYTGDYFGGLSGQHEPHMIEKGLPGAGNILIFDNGASPWNDLGHAGASYALEVDPITKTVVWVYDRWLQFHSSYTSNAQRLENGNTLICESSGRRIFEVTAEGETVWEFVAGSPRAYRYRYDFCPQTAALGRPEELRVTPPKALRILPDVQREGG